MTTLQSLTFPSALRRSSARTSGLARGMAVAALAVGGWAVSAGMSPAQARDNVYWSIGVDSPGVQLGVSNAPPAPVYVQRPRPVYVQPAPVVVYPGYGSGYGHGYERPRFVVPAPTYYQRPPRVVYTQPYGAPIGRDYDRQWRRDDDRGHGRGHGRDRGHNRHRD